MKKLAGAVNCRYLLSLLLSILFAFLIGAGILAVSGFHPLEAYGAMLSGAFDSARHIGDFLEYAMVLCVCGLACVLGARVGIFNVGGEGQLLLGAIFAAQVGVWMDGQPRFLGQADLGAKDVLLHIARRQVVVVVEPDLPHRAHPAVAQTLEQGGL